MYDIALVLPFPLCVISLSSTDNKEHNGSHQTPFQIIISKSAPSGLDLLGNPVGNSTISAVAALLSPAMQYFPLLLEVAFSISHF